jgi:hypothetical protein
LGNNQDESLRLAAAAAVALSPEKPENGGQISQPANSASATTGRIAARTTDSIDVLLDNGSSKGIEAYSHASFSECPPATPRLGHQDRIF